MATELACSAADAIRRTEELERMLAYLRSYTSERMHGARDDNEWITWNANWDNIERACAAITAVQNNLSELEEI